MTLDLAAPVSAAPTSNSTTLSHIKSICVYCAASNCIDPIYFEQAKQLGRIFAENDIALVYGAGNSGLMGALGRSVLENGGRVVGVIPQFMYDENWHDADCTELIITKDMHQRKMRMAKEADAFLALPGGLGTIEELSETLTWKKLGLDIALKPIVICNIKGYYEHFIAMLDRAMEEGFMNKDGHNALYEVANDTSEVMDALRRCENWGEDKRKLVSALMFPDKNGKPQAANGTNNNNSN